MVTECHLHEAGCSRADGICCCSTAGCSWSGQNESCQALPQTHCWQSMSHTTWHALLGRAFAYLGAHHVLDLRACMMRLEPYSVCQTLHARLANGIQKATFDWHTACNTRAAMSAPPGRPSQVSSHSATVLPSALQDFQDHRFCVREAEA
eukprot:6264112-Amphidinium_carterae.1